MHCFLFRSQNHSCKVIHARQMAVTRTTLPATGKLVWQCGDHTAEPESRALEMVFQAQEILQRKQNQRLQAILRRPFFRKMFCSLCSWQRPSLPPHPLPDVRVLHPPAATRGRGTTATQPCSCNALPAPCRRLPTKQEARPRRTTAHREVTMLATLCDH